MNYQSEHLKIKNKITIFRYYLKENIMIKGTNFDATNFPKFFDKNNDDKTFNISK